MNKNQQKRSALFTALIFALLLSVFACFVACGEVRVPSHNPDDDVKGTCVVVFYENEGSMVAPQTIKIGGKISRPADPTRDGYTFGGWFRTRNYMYEWDFDHDTVTESSLILYAKWTPIGGGGGDPIVDEDNCVVAFYADNGLAMTPQTVKIGEKVTRPATPVRDGYEFGGWFVSRDYANEWNFDTDTVTGNSLILYAKWTPIGDPQTKCTVTFVTNCSAVVSQQLVDIGGKVSKPNITNSGYTLDGWFNGNKIWDFDTDTVSGKTLTLTARWTKIPVVANKCTVSFDTGCSATVPQQIIDEGGKVTEPTGVNRIGYTLDGWYNGSSKWNFGVNTVSGSTLTLTAHWTPNVVTEGDVTVTFNVGREARMAGTYNPAPITVEAGNKVTEPQITRDGYTLSGWYVEDGSTKWNFATDTVTENVTLFAKWSSGGSAIQYTPTMQDNNTLYIHYLRSGNDYDGWYIYNWSDGGEQEIKNKVTVDASGAVFAVSLTGINSGLSQIKFIVTQPGWVKDGGDNIVTLSNAQRVGNSYHWYVTQGNTANGKNYAVAASPVGGGTTEPLRESISNVNRAYAQSLPVMSTVDGWDEMGVGYQIFVASFCDSNGDGCGDIRGIISKLDYLQSLNVDVLWLTPIQSTDSYHGYDCYDYYSIDPKFGTNADYRALVSAAHERGMKIIMDLVVNHTSPQNEWFQKSKAGVIEEVTYQDGTKATVNYRDFYRWKNSDGYRMCDGGDGWYFYSSFGGNMPELNYDYQPVRDAMVDVAAYWMSYGLDGFRMDAIKHVYMWEESGNSGDSSGGDGEWKYNLSKNIEFFKEFNYKLKTRYPHCFLLGEQLNGNANEVAPFYQGMDSLFDFNTYYNPDRFNGNPSAVASAFNNNAREYQTNRGDRPINGMISSNHDVPRMSYQFNNDTAKMKLYMAVILTMPGLPWIYYGDEIGLIGPDGDDKNYRQSMKWTSNWANECHNDISGKQFNSNTASVAEQENNSSSLLSYVKSLTKFRNDNPTLINGTATCSEQDGMLKIVVTGTGGTYTVYHNFSGNQKSISGNVVFGSSTIPAYGTAIVK